MNAFMSVDSITFVWFMMCCILMEGLAWWEALLFWGWSVFSLQTSLRAVLRLFMRDNLFAYS